MTGKKISLMLNRASNGCHVVAAGLVFLLLQGTLWAQQAQVQIQIAPGQVQPIPGGIQIIGGPGFNQNDDEDRQLAASVFPPIDREILKDISDAQKLIERQRYAEAVPILGRILELPENYLVPDNTQALEPEPESAENDGSENEEAQEADPRRNVQLPRNRMRNNRRREEGTPSQHLYRNMKWKLEAMLQQLPPEGLKSYELAFGTKAAQILKEGVETNDIAKIALVSQCYFYTQAGEEATFLLGMHQLDHNSPMLASAIFQKLYNKASARRRFSPVLPILLATTLEAVGQSEQANQVIQANQLDQLPEWKQLRLGGQAPNEAPADAKQNIAAWLKSMLPTGSNVVAEQVQRWLLARGNAQRNAVMPADLPILTPFWKVPVLDHPEGMAMVELLRRYMSSISVADIPVAFPLVVDSTVLMRGIWGLNAIDLATGRRLWEVPADDYQEVFRQIGEQMTRTPMNSQEDNRLDLMSRVLKRRLWHEGVYGSMSSDGTLVFCVEDTLNFNILSNARPGRFVQFRGQNNGDGDSQTIPNRLAAYNIKTGKLVWHSGGNPQEWDLENRGTMFLGAPLPIGNELFVIAQKSGEVFLLAMDAATGRNKWRQVLCIVSQEFSTGNLPALSPSYSNGILVCPTPNRALVAVDVATQSILWGNIYTENEQRNDGNNILRSSYRDGSVLIADGNVFYKPFDDANEVICLRLKDGAEVFRNYQSACCLMYARGSKCVGMNRNSLIVWDVNVNDTKDQHKDQQRQNPFVFPFPDEANVSGVGFCNGKSLFVPLDSGKVMAVDLDALLGSDSNDTPENAVAAGEAKPLAEGEAKPSEEASPNAKRPELKFECSLSCDGEVPGNLIPAGRFLLSQRAGYLTAYVQQNQAAALMKELYERDPNSPEARTLEAIQLWQGGKLKEAADCLRKVGNFSPQTMKQLLLEGIEKDFENFRTAPDELMALCQTDEERFELLQSLIPSMEKAEQWDSEFTMCQMFMRKLDEITLPEDLLSGSRIRENQTPANVNVNVNVERKQSTKDAVTLPGVLAPMKLSSLPTFQEAPEWFLPANRWLGERFLKLSAVDSLKEPVARICHEQKTKLLEDIAQWLKENPVEKATLDTQKAMALFLRSCVFQQRFDDFEDNIVVWNDTKELLLRCRLYSHVELMLLARAENSDAGKIAVYRQIAEMYRQAEQIQNAEPYEQWLAQNTDFVVPADPAPEKTAEETKTAEQKVAEQKAAELAGEPVAPATEQLEEPQSAGKANKTPAQAANARPKPEDRVFKSGRILAEEVKQNGQRAHYSRERELFIKGEIALPFKDLTLSMGMNNGRAVFSARDAWGITSWQCSRPQNQVFYVGSGRFDEVNALVGAGHLLFYRFDNNEVRALDTSTTPPRFLWSWSPQARLVEPDPYLAPLVKNLQNRRISFLNEMRQRENGGSVQKIVSADDQCVYVKMNQKLVALDVHTGSVRWERACWEDVTGTSKGLCLNLMTRVSGASEGVIDETRSLMIERNVTLQEIANPKLSDDKSDRAQTVWRFRNQALERSGFRTLTAIDPNTGKLTADQPKFPNVPTQVREFRQLGQKFLICRPSLNPSLFTLSAFKRKEIHQPFERCFALFDPEKEQFDWIAVESYQHEPEGVSANWRVMFDEVEGHHQVATVREDFSVEIFDFEKGDVVVRTEPLVPAAPLEPQHPTRDELIHLLAYPDGDGGYYLIFSSGHKMNKEEREAEEAARKEAEEEARRKAEEEKQNEESKDGEEAGSGEKPASNVDGKEPAAKNSVNEDGAKEKADSEEEGDILSIPNLHQSEEVYHGLIYRVDRNGKSVWAKPLYIRHSYFLPIVPEKIPLLVFSHLRENQELARNGTARYQTLTVYDGRNGQAVYDVETKQHRMNLSVRNEWKEKAVYLDFSSGSLKFTFTEEPYPEKGVEPIRVTIQDEIQEMQRQLENTQRNLEHQKERLENLKKEFEQKENPTDQEKTRFEDQKRSTERLMKNIENNMENIKRSIQKLEERAQPSPAPAAEEKEAK